MIRDPLAQLLSAFVPPAAPRDATRAPVVAPERRTVRPTPTTRFPAPRNTVAGKLREMLGRTADQYASMEDAAMSGDASQLAGAVGPMAMGAIRGFHGTNAAFDAFDRPVNWIATEPGLAEKYAVARSGGTPRVLEVEADVDKIARMRPLERREQVPWLYGSGGRDFSQDNTAMTWQEFARSAGLDDMPAPARFQPSESLRREGIDPTQPLRMYLNDPAVIAALRAKGFEGVEMREFTTPTVGIFAPDRMRIRGATPVERPR